MKQLFPSILIVLDIGAAIVYASGGNWKLGLYWIAAATLTSCVTF